VTARVVPETVGATGSEPAPPLRLRRLGRRDYEPVWQDMRAFTEARQADDRDELWLVEHPPVYTLGQNGRTANLLAVNEIPVIRVDRGGQVTYHGPGQVVAYLLLDLPRRCLGVRELVTRMERAVIALLADYGISAEARHDAPGVYVDGAKIAALGLRVRRGRCYHGLSLNVDMDLAPFADIHPCGYPGLAVTQLRDLAGPVDAAEVSQRLIDHLAEQLGYRLSDN